MIHIAAFGPIRVVRQGAGQLSLVGQQSKRLALLAYLAAARPRGPHRRDAIVALLWPELDTDRARAALRQALHGLRKSLGAEVIATDGTETIALDARTVSCDLWELAAAAEQADDDRVIALGAAPLCDGLFVTDAPGFDDWLAAERRRVADLVRQSAWRAAERAAADRRASDVVRYTSVALAHLEYDETALRRGMQLLGAAGARASALEAYEQFSRRLAAELDVEPTPETQALAAALRVTTSAAAPAIAPLATFDAPSPLPQPQKHGGRYWLALAAGVSVVAIAAAARLAPSASSRIDPRRISVGAFVNESGLRAVDTLARTLEVASRASLAELDNARIDAGSLPNDAAGTQVHGSVRAVGDSLELRAQIVNGSSGALVRSLVTRTAIQDAAAAIPRFSDRVRAAVATWLYPGWGTALSQPPSYESYRLFVDGLRRIKLEQHEEAVVAFRRAFMSDSSFTAAGLLAACELYQTKNFVAADSIVRAIAPRRALLPAVDGHLLDWLTLSLAGNRIGARSAMESIVRIAPEAELAWLQLAIDNVETARPREALVALDHLAQTADVTESWVSLWATRAEALHLVGAHERELETARDGLRAHPDMRVLVTYELRALAALGRVADIDRVVSLMEESPNAPAALRQTALELAAHGHDAAARDLLGRVDAWYARRAPAERASLGYRLGLARTQYLIGDTSAARASYTALLREYPRCLDCVGMIGVLASRLGDSATVATSSARLQSSRKPFSFGRTELWLARIAAARGEADAAVSRLHAAFAAGLEFDVMTHVDPDLRRINPDSVYRLFARVP